MGKPDISQLKALRGEILETENDLWKEGRRPQTERGKWRYGQVGGGVSQRSSAEARCSQGFDLDQRNGWGTGNRGGD